MFLLPSAIGAIQQDPIRRVFKQASLDLQFAEKKSLVDATTGSNLVDHTRASSGTYVGSDGLIKTATTNLLLQSEDFSTTWTRTALSAFGSGSIVNATTAPDGNTTADLLAVSSGTTPGNTFIAQDISKTASVITYTFSAFCKAQDYDTTAFILHDAATLGNRVRVDVRLSDGVVIFPAASVGTFSDASASVTSLKNGWYRIALTGTSATETALRCRIYVNNSTVNTSDGTSGIYLWGAQLEQSSTVGEYVKTTSTINSAPRFNHDPTTGESLGLLVEESRTNSIRNNTMVNAVAGTPGTLPTYWSRSGSGSITEILGTGVENGIQYIDIRFTGTVTNTNLNFETNIAASASQAWTGSVYLKLLSGSITGNWRFAANEFTAAGVYLTTSLVVPISPTSSPLIEQRLTGSLTTTASTGLLSILLNGNGSGQSVDFTLRIGLPQLEQGAFATSVIPTSGTAVTRAADVAGIYDDNFGVFRTNLLQYSEEFDQAVWTKANSLVSPNAVVSPDNKLTADKHIHVGGGPRLTVFNAVTVSAGAPFTFSFYAKAGTASFAAVSIYDGTTSGNRFWFNLLTGQTGSITSIGAGYPARTSTITSVGDGWYRCIATITNGSNTTVNIDGLSACLDTNGVLTPSVSGVYGYLWGAQFEEGSVATDYIKSDVNFVSRASSATYYDANGVIQTAAVDEARTAAYLPDGNGNFVSAGPLLLEAAGTNLLLDSGNLGTANWVPADGATRPGVTVSAPDGTNSAIQLNVVSTGTSRLYQALSVTSGVTYTFSVWMRTASGTLAMKIGNVDVNVYKSVTVTTNWKRYEVTQVASSATRLPAIASDSADGSVYLWGAQLEQSSYPTSYIPTTTSTATRAADVSTSAATTVFESDWYRQEEGTNLIEFREPDRSGTRTPRSFSDGTASNRWDAFVSSTSTVNHRVVISGANNNPGNLTLSIGNLLTKHVIAVGSPNANAACNGTLATPSTSSAVPSVDRLIIGADSVGGTPLTGTIRRLVYWGQRLPNSTLQAITQ